MKIALINESNQGAKNEMIYHTLKEVADCYDYEVDNYGMYMAGDQTQLTYVQVGILAAALLSSRTADYVITGCETGEDAMLACNSFPGMICGHVEDAPDTYIFTQINDSSAITLPFAKGSSWGGDLNLEYIFEELLCEPSGQGYPGERAVPEQKSKKILDKIRKVTLKEDLVEVSRELDQELVKGVFAREKSSGLLFETYRGEKLASYIRGLLA